MPAAGQWLDRVHGNGIRGGQGRRGELLARAVGEVDGESGLVQTREGRE